MLTFMSAGDSSVIYEVRGRTAQGHVLSYGVSRTRADAETMLLEHLAKLAAMDSDRKDEHWIEVIDVSGLFDVPNRPTPRERFSYRAFEERAPGTWTTTRVEVLDGDSLIATYDRNYAMLRTFEPFRQGDRNFALISPTYTGTSVMDLATGEIVAAEEPSPGGFCPVGFYVPDWWDIHKGSRLPGSLHWRAIDDEWPTGDFGFVWGCVWGDDSSWKVQYLDLSEVARGVIRRDDRFGYLKLAADPKWDAWDFIRCSSWEGQRRVELVLEQGFDLDTGLPVPGEDW